MSVQVGHISNNINNINIIERKNNHDNINVKLIELISDLLKNICDKNNSEDSNTNNNIQKFFISKRIPTISIKDYLQRLAQFTKMEESTLIIILIYLDRFCKINNIELTYNNIHKLILTSMFIAIKFNEDRHYSLEIYAKIGGVPPSELEYMEFYFLIFIKFYLNVSKDLYDKYNSNLKSFQEECYDEDIFDDNDEE